MMDARLPWFALAHVPGLGAVGMRRLVARFGSPGAVLAASQRDLMGLGRLTEHQACAVRRLGENPDSLVSEVESLAEMGVSVLLLGEPRYPEALASTRDAPPVLHIRGDIVESDEVAVAVVGTRAPTEAARDAACACGRALAEARVCVVSGMALGIDTAAHLGALEAGGRTVAVLGSGVLRPYPSRNRLLSDQIAARGALVSELPAHWPATRASLMARNRIIAALARAVLVVQARASGGALAAARRAIALGRPAFAMRWEDEPYASGCRLLQQAGARLVGSVEEFLDATPWAD